MKIRDAAEASAKHARKVKEDRVRQVKGRAGETDIYTVIEGFRGDDPAIVALAQPDRDLMLNLANVIAVGFGADTLATTTETYSVLPPEGTTGMPVNPDTGKEWERGEMHEYFQKHGAGGPVVECLMTGVYNRAGDSAWVSQQYIITGRTVKWLEERDLDGGEPVGLIPEALAEIMSKPTIGQLAGPLAAQLGLDTVRAQYHSDMAVLNSVRDQFKEYDVALMLFAEPGSVRHQLLRERFGNREILNPKDWN